MRNTARKIGEGFQVGRLKVIGKTDKHKNGYLIWNCQCECGNVIELDTRYLQRGTVKDCGCITAVRPGMLDLSGHRYGKLVCLEPSSEKDRSGNTQWICQCDCGRLCQASLHQLRSGYKKSCGCLSHPPIKDYVGRRFGRLTVTAYAGKKSGIHFWKCLCDCGKETTVRQTLLQNGRTKSCGCLRYLKRVNDLQTEKTSNFVSGTSVAAIMSRMSKPPISTNKSGYNGVYMTARGRWIAQIGFQRKTYYLGSFPTVQEAVEARKNGEKLYRDFLNWYAAGQEA